jgi:type IV pilus assembly protein PilC
MTYVWVGRTIAGERKTGELLAETQEDALKELRRLRIIVTSVRPKPRDLVVRLPFRRGVGIHDLVVFTRQFATMINAGLPLVSCLDILAKQTESKRLAAAVGECMRDVEAGATLSESMRKHPYAFSDLYVNMIAAGEAGGLLDTILGRLATYLEKSEDLRRRVKGALTYPAVVLVAATLCTVGMLVFVIPTFARVFTDFGGTLPLPTRVVLGLSTFFRRFWWLVAGAGAAAGVLGARAYHTNAGREFADRAILRVPILGAVIQKSAIARFSRTLGTLLHSGVPILAGLEITARTCGNRVLEHALDSTRASIRGGQTIAAPLRQLQVLPPMVVQMISVGEETGSLDAMLVKIADFYDDEVNAAVAALASIIEPVMIVVMGVLVGGMLIAMYLPMFKLVGVIMGNS